MLHSKKIEVMSDTCLSGLSRTGKANAWGMGHFRWGVFFVLWMGNNGRLHHTVLPRLSEHGMLHICWCWPHWDHLLMSARPKKTWGGGGGRPRDQSPSLRRTCTYCCLQPNMFTIAELYFLCFVQTHSTTEGRFIAGFLKKAFQSVVICSWKCVIDN